MVAQGFVSSYWMTFKQSVELGGHVRKGETGTTVVYAGSFSKTEIDANGDEVERGIPFLRIYGAVARPPHYYAAAEPAARPVERIEHADHFFDKQHRWRPKPHLTSEGEPGVPLRR